MSGAAPTPRRSRRAIAIASAACVSAASGVALLAACSDSATTAGLSNPDAAAKPTDGGTTSDGGEALFSTGVLVVHAASLPPLRLCFDGLPQAFPAPAFARMPDANVVGLDVGAVVRLPNPEGLLGRVIAFPESALRSQFTEDGVPTRTCGDLLRSSELGPLALRMGTVTEDLTTGLHVLALTGCANAARDPLATTERCGSDWTAAAGNLAMVTTELRTWPRTGAGLTVQAVQLSRSLDARAQGRLLALGVAEEDAGPRVAFQAPAVFGEPFPSTPLVLELGMQSSAAFATTSLVVQIASPTGGPDAGDAGNAGDGGFAYETMLAQSLAETQRLTLPSSLPTDFFARLSSFVLFTVGDVVPADEPADAGRDPRTRLHLLAVPLGAPARSDAGDPSL